MTKSNRPVPRRHRPRGLEILYEDRDILVVNKEPGLLTMSFRRDEPRTAEYILTDYVRKGCARSHKRVFTVHRLDRETSGLLIFAKSEPAQRRLKDGWKDTEKLYLAAVHGRLVPKSGVMSSYLAEDLFVHSVDESGKGRLAQTAYSVIKETRALSIVKVSLLTGRKNQIRVHFAERGHPVVGDRKYGRRGKSFERLALHARSIAFNHPHSGQRMRFHTPIPEAFKRLAGGLDETDWAGTTGA